MNRKQFERIIEINNIMNKTQKRYKKWAQKNGVNEYFFNILYTLRCTDFNRQKDIAEINCMPKQTVNSVICDFVKNDICTLKTSDKDKRSKIIVLTEKGIEYADSVIGELVKAEESVLNKLGDERTKQFIDILCEYDLYIKEEMEANNENKNI